MEQQFKLKLLRSLTGLSQKELADLMGVSHNFIPLLERNVRGIPDKRAGILAEVLNIDKEWLTNDSQQIIAEKRFVLFCFDGNKEFGPSVATLNKSILTAKKTIDDHLPEIFAYSDDISYRYIGRLSRENALFFVVFNGHGILMKVANCKMIVEALAGVIEGLKNSGGTEIRPVVGIDDNPIALEIFNSISYSAPEKLKEFIESQDIDTDYKIDFKGSIDKLKVSEANESVKLKTLEEATGEYVVEQKRIRFKKICEELLQDNISLIDIRDFMVEKGRSDLTRGLVNK